MGKNRRRCVPGATIGRYTTLGAGVATLRAGTAILAGVYSAKLARELPADTPMIVRRALPGFDLPLFCIHRHHLRLAWPLNDKADIHRRSKYGSALHDCRPSCSSCPAAGQANVDSPIVRSLPDGRCSSFGVADTALPIARLGATATAQGK